MRRGAELGNRFRPSSFVSLTDRNCVLANLTAFLEGRPLPYGSNRSESALVRPPQAPPATDWNWCEFCSWQAGRERLKNRFRTCRPWLARPCTHSENPTRRRSFLFRTSVRICPKRKENPSVGGMRAEVRRFAGWPCPVQDCRRLREISISQRLNRMACIDG